MVLEGAQVTPFPLVYIGMIAFQTGSPNRRFLHTLQYLRERETLLQPRILLVWGQNRNPGVHYTTLDKPDSIAELA
jgi:hypothetical protein